MLCLDKTILAFSAIILIFSVIFLSITLLLPYKNYIQGHHTDVNYFLQKDSIKMYGIYCLSGEGNSMQPTIFDNNLLCFKENKDNIFEEGNIIDYIDNEGTRVVHRISSVLSSENKLIVQGDNNFFTEKISFSQVRGILVLVLYT